MHCSSKSWSCSKGAIVTGLFGLAVPRVIISENRHFEIEGKVQIGIDHYSNVRIVPMGVYQAVIALQIVQLH